MSQKSSASLSWYIALSLVVHITSIAWVMQSLYAVPSDNPEPVRVTFAVPNLPGSPTPMMASGPLRPSPAEISTADRPVPLTAAPALTTVTRESAPDIQPPPPPVLVRRHKATPEPQRLRATIPANVPEVVPTVIPQAVSRPDPALLIPQRTAVPSPTTVQSPTPVTGASPFRLSPAKQVPERPPIHKHVPPPAPRMADLTPVALSPAPPPIKAEASRPLVTPPTPTTVTRIALPRTPVLSPDTFAPLPTRVADRRRPVTLPVTPVTPPHHQLPITSRRPAHRLDTTPKHLASPPVSDEVLTTPVVMPQTVATPMSSETSRRSQPMAQRQESPYKPHQTVIETPQLATPSAGPALPFRGSEQRPTASNGASTPTRHPRFADKPCPSYPRMARQRGSEGTVVLTFEVRADGKIGDIRIEKSSGYTLLDNAAQNALKKWRPDPESFNGVTSTWLTVPFRFELENPHRPKKRDAITSFSDQFIVCDATSKHS